MKAQRVVSIENQNMDKHTNIIRTQEAKLQDYSKTLNDMAAETTHLANQVAIANLTIKKLRAELARVDKYIEYSKDQEESLHLQANKIEHDRAGISQKYQRALSLINSRIHKKEQEINELKLRWSRTTKLRDQVKLKNEKMKLEINRLDSTMVLLKAKLANESSWNVRTFGKPVPEGILK